LGKFSPLYPDPSRILAAPPRCSPDTRLDKKPRGCASGEQRGGAAEILSRIEEEPGRTIPNYESADCPIKAVSVTVQNMQLNAY